MADKLQSQLKEVGSKLENPPANKDALIKLLKQAASSLSELDQSPAKAVMESMQPLLNAIVKPELLKHPDKEVKLLVAACTCEITRITAPIAPYDDDDVLKDIFHLIVSTFSGLQDTKSPSFGRRVIILDTVAKCRSCVVILDLECDDLVNEMFRTFFSVASDGHSETVISSMKTIMVVLLENSEDIREDLLLIILSVLGRDKKDITASARRLAMNVIGQCAGKLETGIKQFIVSSMSGDNSLLHSQIDYHEVIYDIYCCAPQILSGIAPHLTGELLTYKFDLRLKAVRLAGDIFALPGSTIFETFQPIFLEFLKGLTDRVVEVRMSVLEHVKLCLLSDPFRAEAPQLVAALCDRLLDYDESVRKQVVAVVSDVACHELSSISAETVKLVAERLRDKSLLVKMYTMERLSDIYRTSCLKQITGSDSSDDYDWIPGRILRCFYDKDFRSDTVEQILCTCLFPAEFSVRDKVRTWIRLLANFDKVEVKALEKILEQKQRLQLELQKYLSLRQMYKDNDAPELQKKVALCFRFMSHCFVDPIKAEADFQLLDQLKDANVWKILAMLLDASTGSLQAWSYRGDEELDHALEGLIKLRTASAMAETSGTSLPNITEESQALPGVPGASTHSLPPSVAEAGILRSTERGCPLFEDGITPDPTALTSREELAEEVVKLATTPGSPGDDFQSVPNDVQDMVEDVRAEVVEGIVEDVTGVDGENMDNVAYSDDRTCLGADQPRVPPPCSVHSTSSLNDVYVDRTGYEHHLDVRAVALLRTIEEQHPTCIASAMEHFKANRTFTGHLRLLVAFLYRFLSLCVVEIVSESQLRELMDEISDHESCSGFDLSWCRARVEQIQAWRSRARVEACDSRIGELMMEIEKEKEKKAGIERELIGVNASIEAQRAELDALGFGVVGSTKVPAGRLGDGLLAGISVDQYADLA